MRTKVCPAQVGEGMAFNCEKSTGINAFFSLSFLKESQLFFAAGRNNNLDGAFRSDQI
jgi:hypothetical protein